MNEQDDPLSSSQATKAELLRVLPNLRAFAMSLCGASDRADDLVQETVVKAWSKLHTFQEGTNLRAWLFTILRNEFYTQLRKGRREVADEDGVFSERLTTPAGQMGHLDLQDFKKALTCLPDDQKEALILVGASGFSYEEAAQVCGVAVGTVKSRVSRARRRLAELLELEGDGEFGADAISNQILSCAGA